MKPAITHKYRVNVGRNRTVLDSVPLDLLLDLHKLLYLLILLIYSIQFRPMLLSPLV